MENIRVLIKLIYKNSNVPVIEDLNIDNNVTFNKIETTVNEVIENGFMFMCIKMKKEAKCPVSYLMMKDNYRTITIGLESLMIS